MERMNLRQFILVCCDIDRGAGRGLSPVCLVLTLSLCTQHLHLPVHITYLWISMSTCIYIYLCTRTLLYVHIPIFDLIPAVWAHFSAIKICCHQKCQIVVEFNFFWGRGVECIHNIGCLSFFSHQTEIKSSKVKIRRSYSLFFCLVLSSECLSFPVCC